MAPILELRSVSKNYPAHLAVDNLSLDVERGCFFSLLGPSGCGKTTTLRLIAGFEQLSSGQILLSGKDLSPLKPYQRNVSTVFQSYALFPHLTVAQNIEFGLRHKGLGGPDAKQRVNDAMEMLGLTGKESRTPDQLSGGEKQRVALARSLVLRPDVLLLDEPLSALDPLLRKQVRGELKSLQRKLGITFLFVTHDQEEALSLSDRVALLNQGKLEQVGAPRDLYDRPSTRFAANFLGTVNWIGGVGLRPESTRIGKTVAPEWNRNLTGAVEHSMFLGNCLHVRVGLSSGETVIAEVAPGESAYSHGEPVHIWWHPADEMKLPE